MSGPVSGGRKILLFDRVTSTNEVARTEAAKGASEKTVFLAKEQTSGKGRFGRSWFSPVGGLYFSYILRPGRSFGFLELLPILAALAVREGLERVCHLSPKLRWPNDVTLSDRKVAGVLVQIESIGEQVQFVVVGIGVNVNMAYADFPETIREQVTSTLALTSKKIDLDQLCHLILDEFDSRYARLLQGEAQSLQGEISVHLSTLGRRIRITTDSGLIDGEALRIQADGSLEVLKDTGETTFVSCSDVLSSVEG